MPVKKVQRTIDCLKVFYKYNYYLIFVQERQVATVHEIAEAFGKGPEYIHNIFGKLRSCGFVFRRNTGLETEFTINEDKLERIKLFIKNIDYDPYIE